MHSDKEPSRTSGLSTEDLLRERPGGPAPAPAQPQEGAPRAPLYPGESTGETPPRRSGTGEPSGAREPSGAGEPTGAGEPSGGERLGAGEPSASTTATTAPQQPAESQATAPAPTAAPGADTSEEEAPRLLTEEDEQGFRDRWKEAQSRFVDDPREAVHTADTLVADVMQTLAATFARHKEELEAQWSQGEQVDTEALRRALRRYRSFFNRLLST